MIDPNLLGNVFETRALDELIPDWKEKKAPLDTPVTQDSFLFLSEKKSWKLPNFLLPPQQVHLHGICVLIAEILYASSTI